MIRGALVVLVHAAVLQAADALMQNASQEIVEVPGDASSLETPESVEYIDKQPMSYLAYILLGFCLCCGTGLLVYLCNDKVNMAFVESLKLQVPRPWRLCESDLSEIDVEDEEEEAAVDAFGQDVPRVSQAYLVWRRSQLNTGMLFYVIGFILTLAHLHQEEAFNVNIEKDPTISTSFVMRNRAKTQLLQFVPLAQCTIATAFYSVAAWRWVSYSRSTRLVAFGWFLVFFLPFVYFFVPWMDIVSPNERVRGLCKYCLTLVSSMHGASQLQLSNGLPVTVDTACTGNINDIANRIEHGLKLVDPSSENSSDAQLVLVFVGLLLRYIIYLPFLVGALQTLKTLAPGVLGLMLGLQGGLKMSKLMFPGVRMISWMLIVLQASAVPVIMCIMALLLVVVGTVPVMATAVLITASMALFLVYADQLLKASTRAAAQVLITKLTRIAIILQIMGLGLLILGIYMADHLTALREQGVAAVKSLLDPLFIARMIMKTLAGMFVSRVLFVDVMLHIMMSTYIGVYDDPSEMRKGVFKELTSFAHLFPNYVTYKAVIPAPAAVDIELLTITSRDASTSIDINSDNEEHFLSINHGVPYHAYGQDALHDQAVCL